MKVRITKKHIETAIARLTENKDLLQSLNCPIAIALQEHFKDSKISVNHMTAGNEDNSDYYYKHDGEDFVSEFDRKWQVPGYKFKPITIEVTKVK